MPRTNLRENGFFFTVRTYPDISVSRHRRSRKMKLTSSLLPQDLSSVFNFGDDDTLTAAANPDTVVTNDPVPDTPAAPTRRRISSPPPVRRKRNLETIDDEEPPQRNPIRRLDFGTSPIHLNRNTSASVA